MLRLICLSILISLGFTTAALSQSSDVVGLTVVESSWKPFVKDNASVAFPKFPHQDYPIIGSAPPRPEYQRTGPNGEWRVYPDREPNVPNRVEKEPDENPSYDAVLKLKNDAGKPIKSFIAEFVFTNREGKEFLRYEFAQNAKLRPGQESTFKRNITGRKKKEYSRELNWDIMSDIRHPESKIAVRLRSVTFEDGSVANIK